MTAIAGVFGAGAAGDENVRRMLDAAAHRGAGAPLLWAGAHVVLGVRPDARSSLRGSPLAASPDGSALVLDGRLDNRDDLVRTLSLDARASDAEIVLASYERSAADGIAQLLGDFAFLLWDERHRQFVGGRDHFGQRPLFHGRAGNAFVAASEPQQVLAHPGIAPVVNEGFVAEVLSGRPSTVDETVWAAVRRVLPAHVTVATDDSVRTTRYWDLEAERATAPSRDEEYVEEFNALFREAIDCRTRDARGVGVLLSGGLDSSAIAAVAEGLARTRGASPVHGFSLTYPGLAVDETPFIEAVVDQWGLRAHLLPVAAPTRDAIVAEVDRYRDLPSFPNGLTMDPLRRLAAREVEVVLSGYGGDEWFTGSPAHTSDLLRDGQVAAAGRQLLHDLRLPGRSYTAAGLLRGAIAPLLSPRTRALLRPIAGGPPPAFPWIAPELVRRTALHDRLRPAAARPFPSHVQASVHRIVNSLQQMLGDELEDRAAAAAGLSQRHPFNDRRLAQFGFTLPERLRWHEGETKVILRRALGESLPRVVRERNDKAEFSPVTVQAIEALGGADFLARLNIAEAGWVNAAAVRRAYDDMHRLYSRGDEAYIPLTDVVWNVAAVELWFTRQIKERP